MLVIVLGHVGFVCLVYAIHRLCNTNPATIDRGDPAR